MKKKLVYAIMLSCVSTLAFAQKNVTVNKARNPITIDGVKDQDYGEANSISNCIDLNVKDECGPVPPQTNCDNISNWSATYDQDNLYVFFSVKDSKIVTAILDPSKLHENDGIDIVISMDNDRSTNCPSNPASWPKMYKLGTYQFQGRAGATPAMSSPNGMNAAIVDFKKMDTPDGYDYEVALSWFELDFLTGGLLPTCGAVIGFDASNNDADVSGGARQSQTAWNACCADRNWATAEKFGTITLEGCVGISSLTSIVSKMVIAPNPATNQVTVIMDAKQQDQVVVSIMNTLSQQVYSNIQTLSLGQNTHEIPTGGLANGIYTVVISKGNLRTTEKLVISR